MSYITYEHAQIKKMLHYINVWFLPFRWGINSYRGCEHNCVYCNARYTHEYLGLTTGEFTNRIIVKDNAAEVYRKNTSEDLGKYYQQGEHALTVFGTGEDVSKLREEISQKNKELQNLVNSLATENISLRNRVDQMEKEISKISNIEQTVKDIQTLIKHRRLEIN